MMTTKQWVYLLTVLSGLVLVVLVHRSQGEREAPPAERISAPVQTPVVEAGAGQRLGALQVQVPEGWIVENPSSALRLAQFVLPHSPEDREDAQLVVFNRIGGNVEQNLERWYGQFTQPDQIPSRERARVSQLSGNQLPITTVYLEGTYSGSGMMGARETEKEDYCLLAAIVETPEGAYYFKTVGPRRTVNFWRGEFDNFITTLRYLP